MNGMERYIWIRHAALIAAIACVGTLGAQEPAGAAKGSPKGRKISQNAAERLMEIQREQGEAVQNARALVKDALKEAANPKAQSILVELDLTLAGLQAKLDETAATLAKESPEALSQLTQKEVQASQSRGERNRAILKADRLAAEGKYKEAIATLKPYADAEPDEAALTVRMKTYNDRLNGPSSQSAIVEYAKLRNAAIVLEETGTKENLKLALEKWKKIQALDPAYAKEAEARIKDLEAKPKS